MLRRCLERISRGKVFRRRLPVEFGRVPFYVTPDAALRYLKPSASAYDDFLLDVVKTQVDKNSVVWDVGANVGQFTFAAASIATEGEVLAIEADIWLAGLLRRSVRLEENKNLNIGVLPAAISSSVGVAEFCIAQRGRASNFLSFAGGRSPAGGIRTVELVPTLTLDQLIESRQAPNLIKIDVEGAEIEVLRGATRMLSEVRPTICIEMGDDQTNEVTRILLDHNYGLFDASLPPDKRVVLDNCVRDTLYIPD